MPGKYGLERSDAVLASRIHPLNTWFYMLPAHARRRIEYSFRTTVTTLVCLLLSYHFGWSSFAAFLSPSNSIASSSLHIGIWQSEMFSCLCSSLIGSLVGVVLGLASGNLPLQIVLLFFVLTWLNKVSVWDWLQKAYASQAVILCGSLVSSQYTPINLFYTSLMVLILPYMITGFTLLLVFPASALFTARAKVIIICRKFSLMLSFMIKAFHTHEYINLYCAEFDQLAGELEADLKELKSLAFIVKSERIIFPNIVHLPNALEKLHEILDKMLLDLCGLKDALKMIQFNQTNEVFVAALRSALEEMDAESEIAFCIVGEYFDAFELIPHKYYAWLKKGFANGRVKCSACFNWCTSWRKKHNKEDEDDLLKDASTVDLENNDEKPFDIRQIMNREHRGTSSAYNLNIKQVYGVPASLDLMKKLSEKRRSHAQQENN